MHTPSQALVTADSIPPLHIPKKERQKNVKTEAEPLLDVALGYRSKYLHRVPQRNIG